VLNITEQRDGKNCEISIEGELVATTLDRARNKVKELISDGVTLLTINMSRSNAIDSAGIGFIAATHNSLEKNSGELKLKGLSKDMYDFFVCLRMHTHFAIETRE
jgi:anti-anti-sigma factor